MFGITFPELMVILVVALVVVGPEQLPKVARTLGMFWARAQRYVNGVKADMARDMAIDDFRQMQQRINQEVLRAEQALKQGEQSVNQSVEQQVREINVAVAQPVPRPAVPGQPAPSQIAPSHNVPGEPAAASPRHEPEPPPRETKKTPPEQ